MGEFSNPEYPRELIAQMTIRLLEKQPEETDSVAFNRAAERACELLEICDSVASRRRRERYGLLEIAHGPLVEFRRALKRIDQKFRTLPRSKAQYGDVLFDLLADPGGLDPLDEKSRCALRSTVADRIRQQEERGIPEGAIEHLRVAFTEWRKKNASLGHSVGGKRSAAVRAKVKSSAAGSSNKAPKQ